MEWVHEEKNLSLLFLPPYLAKGDSSFFLRDLYCTLSIWRLSLELYNAIRTKYCFRDVSFDKYKLLLQRTISFPILHLSTHSEHTEIKYKKCEFASGCTNLNFFHLTWFPVHAEEGIFAGERLLARLGEKKEKNYFYTWNIGEIWTTQFTTQLCEKPMDSFSTRLFRSF